MSFLSRIVYTSYGYFKALTDLLYASSPVQHNFTALTPSKPSHTLPPIKTEATPPPHFTTDSSAIAQSNADSWRSELDNPAVTFSHNAPQLSARSAVNPTLPILSLLTPQLVSIGEQAISTYNLIRENLPEPLEFSLDNNPFSALLAEELEEYYSAAIDVKNALGLRRSAVKADIGDSLENIIPKVGLYQRDDAVLNVVAYELQLIVETCSARCMGINFFRLEYQCSLHSQHQPSIFEKHKSMFSTVWDALDSKGDVQEVADRFIKDPSALIEHRLPPSRAWQT